MADRQVLFQARDLRSRAEEIRTRAETFHDADARQTWLRIAAGYVELAEGFERHARNADDVDTV
jgi:hypothetical protein